MTQRYLFLDNELSAELLGVCIGFLLRSAESGNLVILLNGLSFLDQRCLQSLVLCKCAGEVSLAENAAIGAQ